jgi:radical SAM superfamily enzyme YgiQ (UPF0313 family)
MGSLNNRILLINANTVKPPIAPIGLDYVGSSLTSNGFQVELLDLNFSDRIKDDIRKKLTSDNFLAIGVTIRNTDDCYFLSQDNFLIKIKDIIGHIKTFSDSPIILGGGGFSIMPLQIIKYLNADYGIIGDGEFIFIKLLNILKGDKKYFDGLDKIRGLVVKEREYNPLDPRYLPLKELPLPERDLVDNVRYYNEGGMGSIETKRGCNKRCIYCADPLIKGKKIRIRPVKTVVKEINNLVKKDINYLHFCDSEFNNPLNQAKGLLKQIIAEGLGDKIRWYAYMSPVPFDEDFAILLKRSGCEGINFGVDSTYSAVLKNLRRDHVLKDLENITKLCNKHKIRIMFDLLLGGPGENKDTIRNSIESIKKLDLTCVGISYGIRVYPGTGISKIISKKIDKRSDEFLNPTFFISDDIKEELIEYTYDLVSGDDRFFIGMSEKSDKNYNYNENLLLQDAIINGYRGAYWDILKKIKS